MAWTFFGRTFGNNSNAAPTPPAAPTLAVVDNADGATATATIAGSTAGSANVVWTQVVDVVNNARTWVNSGSRTGDGSLTLSLAPNFYFAQVISTLSGGSAVSPAYYFAVSRASRSVQDRLLDAVVARVKQLSLIGLATPPGAMPAANIVRHDQFDELILPLLNLPAIVVSTGISQNFLPGTNARDDLGKPFVVVLVDRGSPQNLVPFPTWLLWEERISRGLRYQRLGAIPEIYSVEPQDYKPHSWSGPEGQKGYDIHFCAMPHRAIVRDSRGT